MLHKKVRPCDKCNIAYSSLETLKRHKESEAYKNDEKHHCEKCDHVYCTKDLLSRHFNEMHTKIQELKAFHSSNDRQRIYKCDKCDAAYRQQNHLGDHKKSVSYAKSRKNHCEKCPYVSCSSQMLKKHCAEAHGVVEVTGSAKVKIESSSDHQPIQDNPALFDDNSNADFNGFVPVQIKQESTIEKSLAGLGLSSVPTYADFDLTENPEIIAQKMVEGVNIPGIGQPITVQDSTFPPGWLKRVFQRPVGQTKGKWEAMVVEIESGRTFRKSVELQTYITKKNLPYNLFEQFDFSIGDTLIKLRQIWKKYKCLSEGPSENVQVKNPSKMVKREVIDIESLKVKNYSQFDMNEDPEIIAENMVEGINIPGMGQPIVIDSDNFPSGWQKQIVQRSIGKTLGKSYSDPTLNSSIF